MEIEMKFNFLAFRAFVFWVAIVGIVGNQVYFGIGVLNQLESHNELVRGYHDIERNRNNPNTQTQSRPSVDEAVGNFAISLAVLSQGDEILDPDYAKIFLNPSFPFQFMSEWNFLNHILAWGGLAGAFVWFALKISIQSGVVEAQVSQASVGSWGRFVAALKHPQFYSIDLTNVNTGQTITVKRSLGIFDFWRTFRFWFVLMFKFQYKPVGIIGIGCIASIFLFESLMINPRPLEAVVVLFYFLLGIIVALNFHKLALANYLATGWKVVR